MSDSFKTQGTHLFFADTVTTAPTATVAKLTCPTSITNVNAGTADRVDITCLDNVTGTREYVGGLAEAGEVSVPFVLYKGSESHKALFELNRTREEIAWMVGLSDDTEAEPTLGSDDSLVRPTSRTTLSFDGYVSGLTIDAATNEVVRGTLTIQTSGPATYEEGV